MRVVIGKEDADGLTKTKACVVCKPGATVGEDELKTFVKERLAAYKYPRFIEFIDELPKTATGKIQRFRLREIEHERETKGRRRDGQPDSDTRLDRVARPHAAPRDRLGRRRCVAASAARVPARRAGLGRDVERTSRRVCVKRMAFAASCSRATATAARRRNLPTSSGLPISCNRQAHEVLPALFAELRHRTPLAVRPQRRRLDRRCCTRRASPATTRWPGVIAVAPHLFVEDISIASIEQAREAYETTDLRQRLMRYHDDPDSALSRLERRVALFGVSRLEHRGRDRDDPLPDPCGCRVRTTSTAHSIRFARSCGACRKPLARDSKNADTLRTATSPSCSPTMRPDSSSIPSHSS